MKIKARKKLDRRIKAFLLWLLKKYKKIKRVLDVARRKSHNPKKNKAGKLPHISRRLTARVGTIVILALLIFYSLLPQPAKPMANFANTANPALWQKEEEITYWEKVSVKRPNYRDAYLELAIINYQLGRIYTAREYLETARELDPNFGVVAELEKIF